MDEKERQNAYDRMIAQYDNYASIIEAHSQTRGLTLSEQQRGLLKIVFDEEFKEPHVKFMHQSYGKRKATRTYITYESL